MKIRSIVLGQGMPCICVPVMARDGQELVSQAKEAVMAGADLLEFRADAFEKKEEGPLLKALGRLRETVEDMPVLFTLRTKAEGGSSFDCPPALYRELNLLAVRSALVDLVDIEALREDQRELVGSLQNAGVKVIASSHDFQGTREDEVLLERFQLLSSSGADILKMAVMPQTREDVLRFMGVVQSVKDRFSAPIIAMSMGELGRESRILGERFGSCLTFGTAAKSSAPGQFPAEQLRQELRRVHREELKRIYLP